MRKARLFTILLLISLLLSLGVLNTGCDLDIFRQEAQTPAPSPIPGDNFPTQPGYTLSINMENSPDFGNLVEVVNRVRPAVVAIEVEIITEDFFNRPVERYGAGSGWIFDSSGLIATNHHVIEGASTIIVILNDGRTFNAEAAVSDPATDMAVIKVNAVDLPTAAIGSSELVEVGQMVAAMGNALGRGISATGGWVSRKNVSLNPGQGVILYDLIETDAAINPGNSGGPLLNMEGEVIGITNAKFLSPDVEGVAFAISSQTFVPIIEDLVRHGVVRRPYLGIQLQTLTPDVANVLGLSVNRGVMVSNVDEGSPAEQAGLRQRDVIISIDEQEVFDVAQVVRIVRDSAIGDTIDITFVRGDTRQTVNVTLADATSS